ncbi:hypothetical protein PCANC_06533 [Puccinia coronata f. sp. avenae]|uniref:Uncharacterized protein n=1 Tax=Puccinia coronata f. sp. avenae TaxID=200324 RepID=A0A2N5SC61_9BASI|nr:hypothetical protein PCASD_22355 [Puccinia coronata f. sp. avenae]PLW46962.1 hypothetical protein PCANC_06533 [Puccinia coronata f. sp. avenae]
MEKPSRFVGDIPPGGIPAGADPFAHVAQFPPHRFIPRLSRQAISILAVFLVFHILLSVFSLIILILPYIGKVRRTPWLVRKIYIYSSSGEKLYNTPLYFLNAGVLMSASQLMSSVTTQAYIWMQVRMHLSEDYALRAQFVPALALMFIFNTYSYWSMTHCFLALSYTNETLTHKSIILSWLRSPISINTFFIAFPVSVTVATITVMTRLCLAYQDLLLHTRSIKAILSQGSLLWNQLKLTSLPEDGRAHILSQLIRTQDQLDLLLQATGAVLTRVLDRFYSVRSIMLVSIPATSLFFFISFWKLADKYKKRGQKSNKTMIKLNEDPAKQVYLRSESEAAFFDTLRSDDQFVRLTITAVATLLGILTGMSYWFLTVFKSNAIMIDPYWHGVGAWMPTISGTWSALPMAWQSWQLYLEKKDKMTSFPCESGEASMQ